MGNLKVTLNPKEKKDKKLKRNKTTGKTTQKKFRNGNSSWKFFEKMMGTSQICYFLKVALEFKRKKNQEINKIRKKKLRLCLV